jgi:hypothetical protein
VDQRAALYRQICLNSNAVLRYEDKQDICRLWKEHGHEYGESEYCGNTGKSKKDAG